MKQNDSRIEGYVENGVFFPFPKQEESKEDCKCHEQEEIEYDWCKSRKIIMWRPCITVDPCTDKILREQKDREYCHFTFLNNLKNQVSIKYLKLSHVFDGREAFVYEAKDINHEARFIIDKYAIGLDLNSTADISKIALQENKIKAGAKDSTNIYDKLYVTFVIEHNGEYLLFKHSYEDAFFNEFKDLFYLDAKTKKEYMKYINIHMYFDPIKNDFTKSDDFELKIAISNPMTTSIKIEKISSSSCEIN